MQTAEYDFLSERQREFLENPDEFNSQRSAELAYRIRCKCEAAREDFELLHETPFARDKIEYKHSAELACTHGPDERGPTEFGGCDNRRVVDQFMIKGSLSQAYQQLSVPGWNVPENPMIGGG